MIHYVIGSATKPEKKPAIIAHVCNDVGKWGAGFVLALRKDFPKAEHSYRNWSKSGSVNYKLGGVQIIETEEPDIFVANMIGQRDVKVDDQGNPPIRYEAVKKCLEEVNEFAKGINASVHMPRIGCGLAGGDWKIMEEVIKNSLTVETYIYTLEKEKDNWDEKYEDEEEPEIHFDSSNITAEDVAHILLLRKICTEMISLSSQATESVNHLACVVGQNDFHNINEKARELRDGYRNSMPQEHIDGIEEAKIKLGLPPSCNCHHKERFDKDIHNYDCLRGQFLEKQKEKLQKEIDTIGGIDLTE